MIKELLGAGADLGIPNKEGETAMALMGNVPPDIVEEILDNCVVGERNGTEFYLTLNFPFLNPDKLWVTENKTLTTDNVEGEGSKEALKMKALPPKEDKPGVGGILPETNSLLFMIENPEYNHLLEHPVVKSFLSLKFWGVAPLYVIKTFFYLIFASFVTSYIFLLNNVAKEGSETETNAEAAMKWIVFVMLLLLAALVLAILSSSLKESVANLTALTKLTEEVRSPDIDDVFMIKKAFKPFTRILSDPEWWLKLGVLISCLLLIFLPREEKNVRHLSATTVLLVWTGFLFQLAIHPYFALHRNMFVTISTNFLKFLMWYLLLILAFALSFFFLFHMPKAQDGAEQENEAFETLTTSILKTIIMVFTGEIDFGDLVFVAPFGEFIFILFVFFILLVVLNLLNGLAVSDIGIIQQESEINRQKALMRFIVGYEQIMLGVPDFARRLSGFSFLSSKLKNRESKFLLRGRSWTAVGIGLIPGDILNLAKALVVKKMLADAEEKQGESRGGKKLEERMARIEVALERIGQKLENISS